MLNENQILEVQQNGMPEPESIGTCECGCNEDIYLESPFYQMDDKYFVDELHFVKFAKENYGLEWVE